ncbi:MAG: cytochrome c-type biogenesis protein CcmH [Anaerolineae bacterium]|jgi:cytochrome c-type biogenesis protein CcmH
MFKVLRFTFYVLLLTTLFNSVVYAQASNDEISDDDVNRVARQLYCPICENTPLDVCETQACEDWRELIREKLAAGQSDQEIIEYFAEIYGERVRATPSTRDLSLVVWVLPVIMALVVVVYFVRLLRRWLAQGAMVESVSVSRPDEAEVDDYRARLEKEIRESS